MRATDFWSVRRGGSPVFYSRPAPIKVRRGESLSAEGAMPTESRSFRDAEVMRRQCFGFSPVPLSRHLPGRWRVRMTRSGQCASSLSGEEGRRCFEHFQVEVDGVLRAYQVEGQQAAHAASPGNLALPWMLSSTSRPRRDDGDNTALRLGVLDFVPLPARPCPRIDDEIVCRGICSERSGLGVDGRIEPLPGIARDVDVETL